MKEFFENINGCEVLEYHEATTKGRFLLLIFSYLPFMLMVGLLCVTFVNSYVMLRYNIDYTSVLLRCIALGVLVLLLDIIARIVKEEKIVKFHECCIFRYTDIVADMDMFWIKEQYDIQKYGSNGDWIAIEKRWQEIFD